MKRTYGKLKTVLLALLCMALVFSLAFASIAVAEPQQTSGPITVTHDTDNKTLTVTLDALRLGDISKTTLSDAGDEIVEAVKAIIFDQFISDGSPVAAAIDEEGGVDSSMLGEYRDTLTDKLKEPGQLDKYLEGGYDILIKQAAAEYNKTHEMPPDDIVKFVQEVHDIVNEAINDQYSGDTNKIEELQERNRAKVNELAETIQDIVDGKEDSLTLADLLNAIEKLTVGDNTIRDDGWQAEGIKNLIGDLFEQISRADKELTISYDIVITTAFGEANITIRLEIGNYDGSDIQTVIRFFQDNLSFRKIDGVWTLNVNVPDSVNVLALFEYLPASAQRDLFELSDKTGGEIFDFIDGYTTEQTLELFKGINYDAAFGALLDRDIVGTDLVVDLFHDFIKAFASKSDLDEVESWLRDKGFNGLHKDLRCFVDAALDEMHALGAADWTEEEFRDYLRDGFHASINRILDEVQSQNGLEPLCNHVKNFFKELRDYTFGFIKEGKLTNIVSGGNLSWSGKVDIIAKDYDVVLTRIARAVSDFFGIADRATVDSFVTWLDNNINYKDVALSLHASIPQISKVTYSYNGKTVTGLLPNGVNVADFGPDAGKDGKDIIAWLCNDEVIDKVNGDATYTAVTEFDVAIGVDGIEGADGIYQKDYDRKDFTLSADVISGEGHPGYTYQWYRASIADPTHFEPIENATASSLKGSNVSDSGIYYCRITSDLSDDFAYNTDEVSIDIAPKSFTLADAWDYTQPLTYTGKTLSIDLTAEAKAALNNEFGPKWQLENNSAIDEGTYTARVTLTDSAMADNYELDIHQEWEIVKVQTDPNAPANPDGEKGHVFTVQDQSGNALVIDGTTIQIKDVTGAVNKSFTVTGSKTNYGIGYFKEVLTQNNKNLNATIIQLLDLKFLDKDGKEYDAEGTFEVTLMNAELFGSVSQQNLIVIHIHKNAQTLLTANVANGSITFTVNNFSSFAILSNAVAEEGVDTWWIWVLLAIVIVLNIVIILLLLLRRKDDSEPDEPQEASDDTAATEEQPQEETQEEQPQEEPQEQQPQEEPTQEEQPQEEQPVPEPTTITEDAAPVEDTVPAEPADNTPIIDPFVATQGTTLDRSFTARLCQADESLKEAYSAIKNELLSYKKIRSRTSWKFDSFYKGRNKCAIVLIRGKKLSLYLALDAQELAPKYHAKDVSDKARFKSVPTLVKVSGKRSLLYAKQLIALMMERLGAEHGTAENVNYKIRTRSTDSLIRDGFIKVKESKGRFASKK